MPSNLRVEGNPALAGRVDEPRGKIQHRVAARSSRFEIANRGFVFIKDDRTGGPVEHAGETALWIAQGFSHEEFWHKRWPLDLVDRFDWLGLGRSDIGVDGGGKKLQPRDVGAIIFHAVAIGVIPEVRLCSVVELGDDVALRPCPNRALMILEKGVGSRRIDVASERMIGQQRKRIGCLHPLPCETGDNAEIEGVRFCSNGDGVLQQHTIDIELPAQIVGGVLILEQDIRIRGKGARRTTMIEVGAQREGGLVVAVLARSQQGMLLVGIES